MICRAPIVAAAERAALLPHLLDVASIAIGEYLLGEDQDGAREDFNDAVALLAEVKLGSTLPDARLSMPEEERRRVFERLGLGLCRFDEAHPQRTRIVAAICDRMLEPTGPS